MFEELKEDFADSKEFVFGFAWGPYDLLGQRKFNIDTNMMLIRYRIYHHKKRIYKDDFVAEYEGNKPVDIETAFIYLLPEEVQMAILDEGHIKSIT